MSAIGTRTESLEPLVGEIVPDDLPVVEPASLTRELLRNRSAVVALAFLLLCVAVAVLADFITLHDPNLQSLGDRLQPPSSRHWLGTDDLGRDVTSRLIVGTRVTLLAAAQATIIAMVIGIPAGVIAGFGGRRTDLVLSRLADASMSIPALLLAIAIVGALEPGLRNAMLAIGIVFGPAFFRLARGATIAVRGEAFLEAARLAGTPTWRSLATHVAPNIAPPLIVQMSVVLGYATLLETSISFLGLGAQPPDASWGSMLGRSGRLIEDAFYLVLVPGVAITATVLSFNVVGDGLRDALVERDRQ